MVRRHFSRKAGGCLGCCGVCTVWDGVMFLTHGVYGGSVFRFRILLPALYPAKPPRVFFLDSVFHPLVDPKSGEVELRVNKRLRL